MFGKVLHTSCLIIFLSTAFSTPAYSWGADAEEAREAGESGWWDRDPKPSVPTYIPPSGGYVAPPAPETRVEKYIRIGDEALLRKVDFNTALINYKRAVKEEANPRISVFIQGIEIILANKGTPFANYMRAAFVACFKNDTQTCLINFRKASEERPQDAFAKLQADEMAASMGLETQEQKAIRLQQEAVTREEAATLEAARQAVLQEENALRNKLSQMSYREIFEYMNQLPSQYSYDGREINKRMQIAREAADIACQRTPGACSGAWELHPSNAKPQPQIDPNFDVRNYDPLAQ